MNKIYVLIKLILKQVKILKIQIMWHLLLMISIYTYWISIMKYEVKFKVLMKENLTLNFFAITNI